MVCQIFSSKNRRLFEFNFTKNGIRTDVLGKHFAAYNDIEFALAGALAGLGVVQLPLYMLHEHLDTGRLALILTEYETDGIPINLLYPQNKMVSSRLKAFISWTQELFARTDHVTVRGR